MRNGVTLDTLRKEVLIEAGMSTEAGHAVYSTERLNQMINRVERTMFQTQDWPTQNFEEQVTVPADAQYVNLPTNINFTMIDSVHVSYGTEWLPVAHGITAWHRSTYNTTQRASPVQRWEVQEPGTSQFEVWPIGSDVQTLLFEGSRSIGGMAKDDDTCALDADVIVLRVAAEILGRDRKEDAALKLQTARDLTEAILKRQANVKREAINAGGIRPRPRLREGIDYIAPGRT